MQRGRKEERKEGRKEIDQIGEGAEQSFHVAVSRRGIKIQKRDIFLFLLLL